MSYLHIMHAIHNQHFIPSLHVDYKENKLTKLTLIIGNDPIQTKVCKGLYATNTYTYFSRHSYS